MKHTILTTSITILMIGLTACTSTGQTPNLTSNKMVLDDTNTYPIAAVLKQAAINGLDEMLVAQIEDMGDMEDFNMSIRIIIEPVDTNNLKLVDFKGHQLLEADTVSIFFFDGMPLMTEQGKTYYLPDSLINAGSLTDKDDEYAVFTKQYPVPETARIGSSGKFIDGYDVGMADDGSKTPYTNTWYLKTADNNTTNNNNNSEPNAQLCIHEQYADLAEGDTCFTINKKGDILDTDLKFSMSIEDDKPPMTFTSK